MKATLFDVMGSSNILVYAVRRVLTIPRWQDEGQYQHHAKGPQR